MGHADGASGTAPANGPTPYPLPSRLLFPSDLSDLSFAAFPYCVRIARLLGASLAVVSVLTDERAEVVEEKKRGLEDLARIALRQGVETSIAVEAGEDVAGCLLAYARRTHCEKVVMATRGGEYKKEVGVGGMAGEVVARSRLPVLTVHPSLALGAQLPRRILLPVKPSSPSVSALRWAVALAELSAGAVDLLSVTTRSTVEGARQELQSFLEDHRVADSIRVHVIDGVASHQILRWASELRADLIVLERDGVDGQASALGAVVGEVVSRSLSPVLSLPQIRPTG